MPPASFSSTSFTPDNLIAGEQVPSSRKVTLVSGQNLVRGALLGVITASGKYTLSLSAAGDGSQTPTAILAEACDASGGDKECLIYERGDFNEKAITFGTAHTANSVRTGLRDQGIYLQKAQGA